MKIELEFSELDLKNMIVSELAKTIVEECNVARFGREGGYYQIIKKDVKARTRELIREVFAENKEEFSEVCKQVTINYLNSSTSYPSSIIRKAIAEAQKTLEVEEQ